MVLFNKGIARKYRDSVARLSHNENTRSLSKYLIERAFDYLTVVFDGLKKQIPLKTVEGCRKLVQQNIYSENVYFKGDLRAQGRAACQFTVFRFTGLTT